MYFYPLVKFNVSVLTFRTYRIRKKKKKRKKERKVFSGLITDIYSSLFLFSFQIHTVKVIGLTKKDHAFISAMLVICLFYTMKNE